MFLGCLTLLGHCVFKQLSKQIKTKAQRTTEDLVSMHSVREKKLWGQDTEIDRGAIWREGEMDSPVICVNAGLSLMLAQTVKEMTQQSKNMSFTWTYCLVGDNCVIRWGRVSTTTSRYDAHRIWHNTTPQYITISKLTSDWNCAKEERHFSRRERKPERILKKLWSHWERLICTYVSDS